MRATVAKISDYLTPEQIQQLRGKSDLVGALLVLHAWALIAGSMALFAWWPNPFTFLLAVMIGGLIQIGLGLAQAGFLSAYFPSSVIKGLLAAIGVILILKQIPHLLGHDLDPEGEMRFWQPDNENTLTELIRILGDFHLNAALIGLLSIALLIVWDKIPTLKKSICKFHHVKSM